MRLYEFENNSKIMEGMLTEEVLLEGFLDNIQKAIGDKAKEQVTIVKNSINAMQVLYKILVDPEQLETMTFLIKKNIKQTLKDLAGKPYLSPVITLIEKFFPVGRGLRDFMICLVLASVLKLAATLKDQAVDAVSNLASSLITLPALLTKAVNMAGLMSVFAALKIGDTLFFDLLSKLNQKIMSN